MHFVVSRRRVEISMDLSLVRLEALNIYRTFFGYFKSFNLVWHIFVLVNSGGPVVAPR